MNTNKFLIGGIVGGIAYFLLGWVIYGMILKAPMEEAMVPGAKALSRGEGMIMWAMILGNMSMGFLMSYVLNRAGVMNAMSGLTFGLVVGLLSSLGMNFIWYSQMDMISMNGMFMDIGASTVMTGIVGLIIGAVNGMGNNAKA